jgi:hypothetical protein
LLKASFAMDENHQAAGAAHCAFQFHQRRRSCANTRGEGPEGYRLHARSNTPAIPGRRGGRRWSAAREVSTQCCSRPTAHHQKLSPKEKKPQSSASKVQMQEGRNTTNNKFRRIMLERINAVNQHFSEIF